MRNHRASLPWQKEKSSYAFYIHDQSFLPNETRPAIQQSCIIPCTYEFRFSRQWFSGESIMQSKEFISWENKADKQYLIYLDSGLMESDPARDPSPTRLLSDSDFSFTDLDRNFFPSDHVGSGADTEWISIPNNLNFISLAQKKFVIEVTLDYCIHKILTENDRLCNVLLNHFADLVCFCKDLRCCSCDLAVDEAYWKEVGGFEVQFLESYDWMS